MTKVAVQKILTLTGHKGSLYSLERVSDHEFLSAGGDGMVVLWDLRTPEVGSMVVKMQGTIFSMAYDSGSGMLVVGENQFGLRLVDLSGKKLIRNCEIGAVSIFDIKVLDGYVYVGLGDGRLLKLDLEFKVIAEKRLSNVSVRTITFAKNGKLAVGLSDHSVRVLDRDHLSEEVNFPAHDNSVFAIVDHPGLPILMTTGRDARIKMWDTDRDYNLVEEIIAHMYTINHLAFSPDGLHFVSCSMDKSIKVWDALSFKLLKVIDKARHAGHGTSVNKLLWMNHNETLVSCSDDKTISLWDINFTS